MICRSRRSSTRTIARPWRRSSPRSTARGRRCQPVEARVWHGRGGWQRVTLTGVDLRDEPGVGSRVLRIRDLSALRESERRNAAFLALGQQLGAATTAEAAARIIAAVSDDLLHWDAYFLSLYAREDDLLLPVLSIDLIRGRRTEVPETAPDGE